MSIELLFDTKCSLGEGPIWDHERNSFYWVDIIGKKIFKYDSTIDEVNIANFDQHVGCVSPRKSGGLIVALQDGFFFYDWEDEVLKQINDPESHLEDNRFNDGKCDPSGRFWAGTTDSVGIDGKGALYLLDTDLRVSKMIDNVGTSNGLAWSPDHKHMYFIDTPTKQVVQYNFDLISGGIDQPKIAIQFPANVGLPDGMTIDQDGMLWIAHWGGSGISRWNPSTGKQLDFISIPAINVTSCIFGGEELNELYITTARIGTTDEELNRYPNAGGIFKLKTNVKGCINSSFGS
ncbi:SMP-30/gluconolactonase/LRE family protein [Alkalihalobacillus sp. AL-G]|uniref:SMP-30/gluconolactonase/LRE family protein n=1 Tax=Alkalihalobacillus sp. AL-G TaxID=2926399 RepID=UPI002729B82C|nr:SMP-30/gluconolactonase/LRE family protein [Alkalihalobacillus sp. AL-G]WLD92848.1 SMP-30/gluconolactonase/LRE family protein [Alkalihalobacillus sp. AL-G]